MLNPAVRERLLQIELSGPSLISAFDELVGVAQKAGAPDAIMLLSYAGRGDNLQPGEFSAEIHLVVKQVPQQEEDA
jgi:hypothetical protein